MGIPQWTTPTFALTFSHPDVNLLAARNVYVTFCSGNSKITKTGNELTLEEKSIGVYLTQDETSKFSDSVRIQVNWTTAGGERYASDIVSCTITEQLLRKEIV